MLRTHFLRAVLPALFAVFGGAAETSPAPTPATAPASAPAPAPAPAAQASGLTDAEVQAKAEVIGKQMDAINSDPFTHAFAKDAAPLVAAFDAIIAQAADRTAPSAFHARFEVALLLMLGCDDDRARALVPQLMADARTPEEKTSVIQLAFQMAQSGGRIDEMKKLVLAAKQGGVDDQTVESLQEAILDSQAMPVGKPFPAFALKDTAGKSHALADYAGKVLLIDFWATWCGPCMQEMPHVQAIYDAYHAKGLEILGISLDQDRAKLEAVVAERKLAWPMICDGQAWDGEFPKACRVDSIPHTFLIGADGNLIGAELRGDLLEDAIKRQLAGPQASGASPQSPTKTAPFSLAPMDQPAAPAPAGH